MELPTEIWDIIVKQSKNDINDLLEDMSITELRKVIINAEKIKNDKLKSMRNEYKKYTIIKDAYNQTWIISKNMKDIRYISIYTIYINIFKDVVMLLCYIL